MRYSSISKLPHQRSKETVITGDEAKFKSLKYHSAKKKNHFLLNCDYLKIINRKAFHRKSSFSKKVKEKEKSQYQMTKIFYLTKFYLMHKHDSLSCLLDFGN